MIKKTHKSSDVERLTRSVNGWCIIISDSFCDMNNFSNSKALSFASLADVSTFIMGLIEYQPEN